RLCWTRVPPGALGTVSTVPSRIFVGKRSRWPITRSVSANEIEDVAYRNATSRTLQAPSRGTLWKITSTARKSRNEIRNAPKMSSANDRRDCSCERICAPSSRPYSASESTTLHHQLPRAGAEHRLPEPEQHERPQRLHGEHAEEREAVVLAEVDVDRRLHD